MTAHYDPLLKQWLMRCPRCHEFHTYVYQTRDGDLCERCLTREEKEAA